MSDALTDPMFVYMMTLTLAHAVSLYRTDSIPPVLGAVTWVSVIAAAMYVTATATGPAEQWSGLFLFTFILGLAVRIGIDPGPGAPPEYHGHRE